ncbi:MAG: RNA polymerase factor sigma-54 [Rickettsiales bacterium]|nr:RNA polymerase factor sigma-54 [Rickettsiales bacterium]
MASQMQSLVLKQAQQLVLTPQMQQSLKILQLSSLELDEFIETELEQNPLLEKENDEIVENEANLDENKNEEFEETQEKDSYENLSEENFKEDSGLDNEVQSQDNDDFSVEDYGDISQIEAGNYNNDSDTTSIIEKNFSEEKTLKDHLLEQINLDFFDPAKRIISAYLVEMLDGKGYLSGENLEEEISSLANKLNCEICEIENLILELQKLDPIGVFARSLEECLKIQLKELDRLDPAMEILLGNLPLLAKGEIQKLKKLCKVDDEDLKLMIAEIKALNPRPASNFAEVNAETKIPDLYLIKKSGKWSVELNYDIIPKLKVKKDFFRKSKDKIINENDKQFLNKNINSANFLLRALSQRYDSILRVSAEIAEFQTEFFDKGINFLKPLTMRQVAEKLELHETTIGRVVANKYIATPRGVLELRYFFTNSLSSNFTENDISTESVKNLIKEIIEAEKDILSDDDIAKILNEKGIDVARRTIAKYREAMNIPTSAERKRSRKLMAV